MPDEKKWVPEGRWDSHPIYSQADWLNETANCNSRQSYHEWVNSKIGENLELENKYRQYAIENLQKDGEIEFDSDAVVSIGDDPGAYVQGWVWVPEEHIK